LLVPQPAIDIAALEQLVVPTGIVDPAAFEDQHSVGLYQHGEPVRDDDESAAFGNPQQIGIDDRLAFSVQRTRRLIEDKDTRIADQRAGNRQALTLAAGEIGGALLHVGFVAARQMLDELFRPARRAA